MSGELEAINDRIREGIFEQVKELGRQAMEDHWYAIKEEEVCQTTTTSLMGIQIASLAILDCLNEAAEHLRSEANK